MTVIPYLSQGQGVEIDPVTGLPKSKTSTAPKPSFTQQQVNASLAANPQATFGPSMGVNYGGGNGGMQRIPGFTPDYLGLLNSDAGFLQLKSDLGAQGVADAASRAAQTQRALALFGQVPDFSQLGPGINAEFLNADVTPEARALAQRNTEAGLSVVARQEKAFKDQVRQIKNALAARGALRSGETGHQLQEAQRGFDQAKFDTTAELQDFLAGVQRGFADRQRENELRKAQAAEAAMSRIVQANPATGEQWVPQAAPAPPAPPAAPAQPEQPAASQMPSNDFVDILIRTLKGGSPYQAV